ncbi:MAG: 2OG-Fe(II) oxygenase [Xanthomonadales bacterium]|nr:2OG-Fe(II) oxygenase [Gammaproteobacteria bacterium]MBT8051558.1 2OG-Fe(II) oxygenase [Gammaproteobacteria bacterium]MBT8056461.1 2OG-Fe(II) oxygenase [Gammaproteobacteria bacterium]NNJ78313.1 2OG-Fe(II) oxygenase [Xanthomonadales bacterium]NNL03939.1 2OG-Fe(II) oxygenase [Xanthomonadales bacterium]
MIDPRVLDGWQALAETFRSARPFRHVVIDDFFEPAFCREICAQFPAFKDKAAINENKEVGGKATQERVRSLGPAYKSLDDLVKSASFRDLISRISGIPDLQYDPYYFGGGTHENRQGQELDPHVDFNYHPISRQHRRLNLIVYLNEEWQDEWGGSIQLHRDPYRQPGEDEIVTVTPLMNRCVMFETTEHSWHGFQRIDLPEEMRHHSRRSFALYFYTTERPVEEVAGEHSTIYVERHLPGHIRAGEVLGENDLEEIKRLIARRDQHLKRLYGRINSLTGELAERREDSMAEALKRRIYEFEHSTSWRVTAPLRAVRSWFKR